jgi:acyl-CoA thioesterase-1
MIPQRAARIFQPLAVFLFLLSLCAGIGAAEPAATASKTKTLLVLGDSIAAGYGVDPEQAYPALLQKKIDAAGFGVTVKNAGVSGDTTAGGLRRISWALKQPVDYLLIELGGNDGLRGIDPAETARNLQGIIDKAREKNMSIKILIAGMQMPANLGDAYTKAFRETFSTVAAKNKCALIPFLLEGVGGIPELNQPDRIHPTPAGHKIVAENVWKVLEPILNRKERKS